MQAYRPTLAGKARRELSRLVSRRPAPAAPARAMASFTFDDVPVSAAVAGAALLEARGLRGTFYVSAGLAGRTGLMGPLARAEEIRRLAEAGHEVACHTYSHPDCGRLARHPFADELDRNAEALEDWGLPAPTTFAYPYGEVSRSAKRVAASRFQLARSVRRGVLRAGADLAQAPAVGLAGAEAEDVARRWLQRAAAETAWIIFYTHDVRADPSAWGVTPEALARSIDVALGAGVEIVTAAEGARRMRADA